MSELEREVQVLKMLEREITTYQQQAEVIVNSMESHMKALEALRRAPDLKDGDEFLIPIGGGVVLRSNWRTEARFLLEVGAGVVVEGTLETATETLQARVDQLTENAGKLDSHLRELRSQYLMLSQKVQEEYQRGGNVQEPPGPAQ